MVVWLASYPRSGNTFFRIVLHHVYNLKTFSVYDDPVLDQIGVAGVVGHEEMPAPLAELRDSKEVFFVKTHDLPIDNSPAVYIIRDGRDALVSHAKFVQSFKQKKKRHLLDRDGKKEFERTLEKLIIDKPQFGGWSQHVISWTNRDPDARTAIVRYEDLIVSPQTETERALAELKLNLRALSGGKVPDFETLQAQNPQFFRKGKSGAWREEMPARLHDLFWKHHRAVMERFEYARDGGN